MLRKEDTVQPVKTQGRLGRGSDSDLRGLAGAKVPDACAVNRKGEKQPGQTDLAFSILGEVRSTDDYRWGVGAALELWLENFEARDWKVWQVNSDEFCGLDPTVTGESENSFPI